MLAAVVTGLLSRRVARLSPWGEWVRSRPRWTWAIVGVLGAACVVAAVLIRSSASVASSASPAASGGAGDVSALAARPRLLYQGAGVNPATDLLTLTALDAPGGRAVTVPLSCARVSFAAGGGGVRDDVRGRVTAQNTASLQPQSSFKLDGRPSRTRVSADGRLGAITVFVKGAAHGYAGSEFSTKTTLIDMSTGDVLADLEQFSTWRDGVRVQAADFNFWGVTFDHDSNTFYATLKTAGKTYLVRGDLGLRKFVILHDGVECPSLSPNGRLIAYKKLAGPGLSPWRIYVLDVATMTERAVPAETRSVDDQIEWLDDAHILYALPRSSQSGASDVWVSPIDGSGPARIFVQQAQSPIVIR
jgi:hypothetical protein